jgi:hypothetical protein
LFIKDLLAVFLEAIFDQLNAKIYSWKDDSRFCNRNQMSVYDGVIFFFVLFGVFPCCYLLIYFCAFCLQLLWVLSHYAQQHCFILFKYKFKMLYQILKYKIR